MRQPADLAFSRFLVSIVLLALAALAEWAMYKRDRGTLWVLADFAVVLGCLLLSYRITTQQVRP